MDYSYIFNQLEENKDVFYQLLHGVPEEVFLYKPDPLQWCMLEIICHLYDEEREDFRVRVGTALEHPGQSPPAINPAGWVTERKYLEQDFSETLRAFIREREASVKWLRSLQEPQWSNAYLHPKYGPLTAHLFLSNWLAHDYLHIRQITRLKYNYLKELSGDALRYAGTW